MPATPSHAGHASLPPGRSSTARHDLRQPRRLSCRIPLASTPSLACREGVKHRPAGIHARQGATAHKDDEVGLTPCRAGLWLPLGPGIKHQEPNGAPVGNEGRWAKRARPRLRCHLCSKPAAAPSASDPSCSIQRSGSLWQLGHRGPGAHHRHWPAGPAAGSR